VNKRFAFVFSILFIATIPLAAEPIYLTFVTSGSGQIDKGQVSLRLDQINATISEVVHVDTSNRSAQILEHPGGRRLYVFVYDFLFSSPENLLEARNTTESFLAKIHKDDLIAVAGITAQDGLKMFCAPTADRNKVIAGLNWMGQKRIEGMMEGPEGNLYPEDFAARGNPITRLPDAEFLKNIRTYAVPEKDRKEVRPILLQSIADLGFLLSALDGRKHLILFSPGTDTGGLSINLPLRDKAPKRKRSPDQPIEIEHEDLDTITDTSLTRERIERDAARRGPTKKPQKQSGETLPDLIAGTDTHVHIFHKGPEEHGVFKNLATRTNGNFIGPAADLNATIDQILASDKNFYVIKADAPTEKMKDLNDVNLEVQGKEVEVASKWLIPKTPSNYTSLEKKAKISEMIYKTYNPAPASYRFWSDFLLEPDGSRIPSFVQIDGPFLLQNKAEMLDLEFYGFTTDKDGEVVDSTYFVFSIDLTNKGLQEKLRSSGVKIWNVLLGNLEPATVHWTIVNLETSEMLDQSVEIDGIQNSMTMSHPFFPAMNLNWMVWPSPTSNITKRGKEIVYPYKEGKDMLFFPDISPFLKKSVDGQVFFLRVYNLPSAGKIPSVRVSLVDSNGKTNEVKTLGLLQNPTPVEPKGLGLFWRLATLPDVPAGDYQLIISTTDPAKNQEITRELTAQVQ
jgi:hypothetical protein